MVRHLGQGCPVNGIIQGLAEFLIAEDRLLCAGAVDLDLTDNTVAVRDHSGIFFVLLIAISGQLQAIDLSGFKHLEQGAVVVDDLHNDFIQLDILRMEIIGILFKGALIALGPSGEDKGPIADEFVRLGAVKGRGLGFVHQGFVHVQFDRSGDAPAEKAHDLILGISLLCDDLERQVIHH